MMWLRRLFSLFNVLSLLALGAAAYAYQAVQRPPAKPPVPTLQLSELHPVKVGVYYTDSQVQSLQRQERTVQATEETPGPLAQAALNIWAAGPSAAGNVIGVVPKGTPAPRVYVRGLHYYVDLPPAYTKLNYGSSGERMLVCSITRTLLDKRGQDVTFLVAGQDADTLGRIDLSQSFTRQDCQDE